MSQKLMTRFDPKPQPLYSQLWQRLQQFPRSIAQGSDQAPNVSGPAAAALISAGIGCFTMMVTHHLADTSKAREQIVWAIGSWIPGSRHSDALYGNIGSYSGKETMLLVGWLVSWLILHHCLKQRQVQPRTLFFWMFVLFIAATVMSWHPIFPYLPLM